MLLRPHHVEYADRGEGPSWGLTPTILDREIESALNDILRHYPKKIPSPLSESIEKLLSSSSPFPNLVEKVRSEDTLYAGCRTQGPCRKQLTEARASALTVFLMDPPAKRAELCKEYRSASQAGEKHLETVKTLGKCCLFLDKAIKRHRFDMEAGLWARLASFCSKLEVWYNLIVVYALGDFHAACALARKPMTKTQEALYHASHWGEEPASFIKRGCSKKKKAHCTCVQCVYKELQENWERLKRTLTEEKLL